VHLKSTAPGEDGVLGAVIAIQTFGDFLGFNPHCHILSTDGCFCGTGAFQVARVVVRKDLEEIFRHNVFKMLLSEGKITGDLVRMLISWRHSGFNVFSGPRIYPREETATESLARYIIRAFFSQERMSYVEEDGIVVYRSKDGAGQKVFDALEWLAAMCPHVPDQGEQMVRYYRYHSNVSRGKRHKQNQDGLIPCIPGADGSKKKCEKNWIRLIRKIYEGDPLVCRTRKGPM
jgi:Putative transposase